MFSRFDTIPPCDGQTDGQTDVKPISITCFSIADARKNDTVIDLEVYFFAAHLLHHPSSFLVDYKQNVVRQDF